MKKVISLTIALSILYLPLTMASSWELWSAWASTSHLFFKKNPDLAHRCEDAINEKKELAQLAHLLHDPAMEKKLMHEASVLYRKKILIQTASYINGFSLHENEYVGITCAPFGGTVIHAGINDKSVGFIIEYAS